MPAQRSLPSTATAASATRRLRAGLCCFGLSCIGLLGGALPALAEPAADFVFRNGAVYTVASDQPWAQAVAVRKDRIVYVGSDSGAGKFIGRKTEVVDLAGGMLLPGFIDAHGHISSAESIDDVSLTFREQPASKVIDALKTYVENNPDLPMIRGNGWIWEAFSPDGPTKAMIDPFIPDRPAVLTAIDGHHMWVNSKALAIAGITRDTPDPLPGKSWFQRDPETNEPTGFIVEGAAMQMLRDRLGQNGYPFYTPERLQKAFDKGLPMLAAAGITTLYDAGMRDQEKSYALLHAMEQQGRLPVRIFGSHRYRPDIGKQNDPIEDVQKLRQRYHSQYLSMQMIKVFLDGTESNYTAFMLEPYADKPETRGFPLFPPKQLNAFLQRADAAGIDVHMHVVGDAGARMGLDAVEHAAKVNGPRDRRHALSHTILVDPADIPRFRQLGVVWQSTPAWAVFNARHRTVLRAVGEQRFAGIYPFQAATDAGAVMAYGSDFTSLSPGAIYKPLDQIEIGHTRKAIGRRDDPVMPGADQRLNLGDVIRGYTIGGAYMLHREHEIGSIRVGKKADLVVLARNLFDIDPYSIHDVPVLMTLMDGKVTHRAAPARAAAR